MPSPSSYYNNTQQRLSTTTSNNASSYRRPASDRDSTWTVAACDSPTNIRSFDSDDADRAVRSGALAVVAATLPHASQTRSTAAQLQQQQHHRPQNAPPPLHQLTTSTSTMPAPPALWSPRNSVLSPPNTAQAATAVKAARSCQVPSNKNSNSKNNDNSNRPQPDLHIATNTASSHQHHHRHPYVYSMGGVAPSTALPAKSPNNNNKNKNTWLPSVEDDDDDDQQQRHHMDAILSPSTVGSIHSFGSSGRPLEHTTNLGAQQHSHGAAAEATTSGSYYSFDTSCYSLASNTTTTPRSLSHNYSADDSIIRRVEEEIAAARKAAAAHAKLGNTSTMESATEGGEQEEGQEVDATPSSLLLWDDDRDHHRSMNRPVSAGYYSPLLSPNHLPVFAVGELDVDQFLMSHETSLDASLDMDDEGIAAFHPGGTPTSAQLEESAYDDDDDDGADDEDMHHILDTNNTLDGSVEHLQTDTDDDHDENEEKKCPDDYAALAKSPLLPHQQRLEHSATGSPLPSPPQVRRTWLSQSPPQQQEEAVPRMITSPSDLHRSFSSSTSKASENGESLRLASPSDLHCVDSRRSPDRIEALRILSPSDSHRAHSPSSSDHDETLRITSPSQLQHPIYPSSSREREARCIATPSDVQNRVDPTSFDQDKGLRITSLNDLQHSVDPSSCENEHSIHVTSPSVDTPYSDQDEALRITAPSDLHRIDPTSCENEEALNSASPSDWKHVDSPSVEPDHDDARPTRIASPSDVCPLTPSDPFLTAPSKPMPTPTTTTTSTPLWASPSRRLSPYKSKLRARHGTRAITKITAPSSAKTMMTNSLIPSLNQPKSSLSSISSPNPIRNSSSGLTGSAVAVSSPSSSSLVSPAQAGATLTARIFRSPVSSISSTGSSSRRIADVLSLPSSVDSKNSTRPTNNAINSNEMTSCRSSPIPPPVATSASPPCNASDDSCRPAPASHTNIKHSTTMTRGRPASTSPTIIKDSTTTTLSQSSSWLQAQSPPWLQALSPSSPVALRFQQEHERSTTAVTLLDDQPEEVELAKCQEDDMSDGDAYLAMPLLLHVSPSHHLSDQARKRFLPSGGGGGNGVDIKEVDESDVKSVHDYEHVNRHNEVPRQKDDASLHDSSLHLPDPCCNGDDEKTCPEAQGDQRSDPMVESVPEDEVDGIEMVLDHDNNSATTTTTVTSPNKNLLQSKEKEDGHDVNSLYEEETPQPSLLETPGSETEVLVVHSPNEGSVSISEDMEEYPLSAVEDEQDSYLESKTQEVPETASALRELQESHDTELSLSRRDEPEEPCEPQVKIQVATEDMTIGPAGTHDATPAVTQDNEAQVEEKVAPLQDSLDEVAAILKDDEHANSIHSKSSDPTDGSTGLDESTASTTTTAAVDNLTQGHGELAERGNPDQDPIVDEARPDSCTDAVEPEEVDISLEITISNGDGFPSAWRYSVVQIVGPRISATGARDDDEDGPMEGIEILPSNREIMDETEHTLSLEDVTATNSSQEVEDDRGMQDADARDSDSIVFASSPIKDGAGLEEHGSQNSAAEPESGQDDDPVEWNASKKSCNTNASPICPEGMAENSHSIETEALPSVESQTQTSSMIQPAASVPSAEHAAISAQSHDTIKNSSSSESDCEKSDDASVESVQYGKLRSASSSASVDSKIGQRSHAVLQESSSTTNMLSLDDAQHDSSNSKPLELASMDDERGLLSASTDTQSTDFAATHVKHLPCTADDEDDFGSGTSSADLSQQDLWLMKNTIIRNTPKKAIQLTEEDSSSCVTEQARGHKIHGIDDTKSIHDSGGSRTSTRSRDVLESLKERRESFISAFRASGRMRVVDDKSRLRSPVSSPGADSRISLTSRSAQLSPRDEFEYRNAPSSPKHSQAANQQRWSDCSPEAPATPPPTPPPTQTTPQKTSTPTQSTPQRLGASDEKASTSDSITSPTSDSPGSFDEKSRASTLNDGHLDLVIEEKSELINAATPTALTNMESDEAPCYFKIDMGGRDEQCPVQDADDKTSIAQTHTEQQTVNITKVSERSARDIDSLPSRSWASSDAPRYTVEREHVLDEPERSEDYQACGPRSHRDEFGMEASHVGCQEIIRPKAADGVDVSRPSTERKRMEVEAQLTEASRRIRFRDPFPILKPPRPPRDTETIVSEHALGPPDFPVRWVKPKLELKHLIVAAMGTSLQRRSNACGALKVLTGHKKNQLTLVRTDSFLSALIFAASQDIPIDEKDLATDARTRAVACLRNVCTRKDNRVLVLTYPGFLECLLKTLQEDRGEGRALACESLALLAKSSVCRETIMSYEELVDFLSLVMKGHLSDLLSPRAATSADATEATNDGNSDYGSCTSNSSNSSSEHTDSDSVTSASSSSTDRRKKIDPPEDLRVRPVNSIRSRNGDMRDQFFQQARANACAVLLHLSKQCSVSPYLCSRSVVLESIVQVSQELDNPIHSKCLEILCNLSCFPGNNSVLTRFHAVVDTLVASASSPISDNRIFSFRALQNLSSDASSREILANSPNVLNLTTSGAMRKDPQEKEAAVATLYNISTEPSAVVAITNTKNVVATLVHLAHNPESVAEIRLMACEALATISLWLQTLAGTGKVPEGLPDIPLPSQKTSGWERWD